MKHYNAPHVQAYTFILCIVTTLSTCAGETANAWSKYNYIACIDNDRLLLATIEKKDASVVLFNEKENNIIETISFDYINNIVFDQKTQTLIIENNNQTSIIYSITDRLTKQAMTIDSSLSPLQFCPLSGNLLCKKENDTNDNTTTMNEPIVHFLDIKTNSVKTIKHHNDNPTLCTCYHPFVQHHPTEKKLLLSKMVTNSLCQFAYEDSTIEAFNIESTIYAKTMQYSPCGTYFFTLDFLPCLNVFTLEKNNNKATLKIKYDSKECYSTTTHPLKNLLYILTKNSIEEYNFTTNKFTTIMTGIQDLKVTNFYKNRLACSPDGNSLFYLEDSHLHRIDLLTKAISCIDISKNITKNSDNAQDNNYWNALCSNKHKTIFFALTTIGVMALLYLIGHRLHIN